MCYLKIHDFMREVVKEAEKLQRKELPRTSSMHDVRQLSDAEKKALEKDAEKAFVAIEEEKAKRLEVNSTNLLAVDRTTLKAMEALRKRYITDDRILWWSREPHFVREALKGVIQQLLSVSADGTAPRRTKCLYSSETS